jgi:hypothetical protein
VVVAVVGGEWGAVAGRVMTKIITRSNTDEIAAWVVEFLLTSPSKLVRVEGICGSGKTTIGRKLAASGVGLHIEIDKFAAKSTEPPPYPQCLKQEELGNAIARAVETGKTVILDAVCLAEVAPAERWGRGLSIYVKQLSFNTSDPVWHEGFNFEDEPPMIEPHRSVHAYHLKYAPHMNADLIVEFPEDGHLLPEVPFSRERCFDPKNSVIVGRSR